MNNRERYRATMHYEPRDRSIIRDFGCWWETLFLWKKEQGMPSDVDWPIFFGLETERQVEINPGLCPDFGFSVLEDHEERRIIRDNEGVIKEESKYGSAIPRHLGHTLKDRASWNAEFKHRFDPCNPARRPENWPQLAAQHANPNRDYILFANLGSLYGSLRNFMGLEAVSMLGYDDPALLEEMVETLATCVIESLRPAVEAGIVFDQGSFWEDICYRSGPLISPRLFRQILMPQYRRITDFLRGYGTDIFVVDCDGDITQLAPLWLEAGVNTMFPIEVGVWQHDPYKFRAEFGKEMRLIGGMDKRILAKDRATITAEVERLGPLVEEGGFIPTPDHLLPPDVPFANYVHYIREARRVWGKDDSSLPPFPAGELIP